MYSAQQRTEEKVEAKKKQKSTGVQRVKTFQNKTLELEEGRSVISLKVSGKRHLTQG